MGRMYVKTSVKPVRRLLPLVGLLAAVLAVGSPAYSADGESGTSHANTAVGLGVTIDTRWLDGPGYRPVTITVTPAAPTTVDRTLTVQMDLTDRYRTIDAPPRLRVMRDIELPAGCGPIQTTLLIPETLDWYAYRINVFEDGQLLRRLTFTHSANNNGNAQAVLDNLPRLLVVDDRMPDTKTLAEAWPLQQYYDNGILSKTTTTPNSPKSYPLPTAMARPGASLPTQWLGYSSLDIVCISLEELTKLAEKETDRFRALLEWTAAGGNLWVYGVGDDWKGLPKLGSLADFPAAPKPAGNIPSSRGWQEPNRSLFNQPLRGINDTTSARDAYAFPVPSEPDSSSQTADRPQPPRIPDRAPFVFREYGMGMVVALAAADPFPGTTGQWQWLLNATGPQRWLWYQRHGLSGFRDNSDFWNFLIPGIGLAPVTAFIVLISLFAIVIGPTNYLLLRRWKRLHLMLLTTPLAAGAVTLALFAYAVVADGLGTRVRVRSVTRLDQRRGQAVCWARQSYYSGLAPSGGLRFPNDTAILPLEYTPSETRSHQQELLWGQDQWLASGWLTSRRPIQYLTVRTRPSANRLEIAEAADESKGLTLKNRLGTRIEQLLVRAKDGKYYWAADVAADSTVQISVVDPLVACQRLQETFSRHQPAFLPGVDRQSLQTNSSYRNSYYWYLRQTNSPDPMQSTSLLEAALGLPRSSDDPRLTPGSYLAIVQRSPEVELGTPAAHEQASFHVILGTW
jgi:hypothetical protein